MTARLMLRILAVGMTPFLIIGVDNVMIIAMNAILQSYGGAELGDRLVTCATIAQSFMLVVTMPLGGISAGTGTILAYNYGARRRDRILKAQGFIAILCVAYVTAAVPALPAGRRAVCGPLHHGAGRWRRRPWTPSTSAPWPSSPWASSTPSWTASPAWGRCRSPCPCPPSGRRCTSSPCSPCRRPSAPGPPFTPSPSPTFWAPSSASQCTPW